MNIRLERLSAKYPGEKNQHEHFLPTWLPAVRGSEHKNWKLRPEVKMWKWKIATKETQNHRRSKRTFRLGEAREARHQGVAGYGIAQHTLEAGNLKYRHLQHGTGPTKTRLVTHMWPTRENKHRIQTHDSCRHQTIGTNSSKREVRQGVNKEKTWGNKQGSIKSNP